MFCILWADDAQPSSNADLLFEEFFQEYLKLRPETGTTLGLPEDLHVEVENDLLDDVSEKELKKLYDLFRRYSTRLRDLDRDDLTESERISYDKLEWYLDDQLEGEKYSHHKYIIDPMFSFHNSLTTLMVEDHRLQSLKDAEDYVARLKKYDLKISQYLEQLKIRKEKEIIPPIFIIERFQESLEEFVNTPVSENVLFTSFAARIDGLGGIDEVTKAGLKEEVREAIAKTVYPAYERMTDYSQHLKKDGDGRAGAWKLPDGDAYYGYCLRQHTTTDMNAQEIHELGVEEVRRIQGVVREQLEFIGFPTEGEYQEVIGAFWNRISSDAPNRFFYPDNEAGREWMLRDYQAIVDRAEERIPELFSLVPQTPVVVKRVPRFKEQTTGTHYQPLKLDGASEGIFYVNLSHGRSRLGMECLAYHEAIPGHHFQIALERESPDSRLFHTLLHPTGYLEGWALYVERLAHEQRWYNDTYSVIGYHMSELFRAVRLVVDTGIHAKRWSRERAYQYMVENLGWGSYQEIDRYITWPGQACAYKVGEMKILELRKKAEERLGERFDIKEFHEVVLKHGAVPLTMLERIVDAYLEEKLNAPF